MAGAPQPSEEDIENLLMLVDNTIDRPEAVARLKGNNNNLQQALNEYFENPTSTRYTWDENDFSSDRDGTTNHNGIAFNIQGPDVNPPYFEGQIGAPSRPPSRASHNKSPQNQVMDLSASHAAADPQNSRFRTDEDQDYQRAVAASVADLAPQETGVMETGHTHFGPATRDEYEASQWDLVPMGNNNSAQEILLDPEPAERKRDLHAPAFLKPSTDDHRLGALLTIYHEIPVAREIFLQREATLSDYGHDKEWWNGKAIETSRVSEDGQEESEMADRFCYELQRIMAFLDKTDRSYGSAEVLAKFPKMRKFKATGFMESAFFETWSSFWGDDAEDAREKHVAEFECLFSRGVPGENATYDQGRDFAILRLDLPEEGSSLETMYDLADQILWNSRLPLEVSASPYLSHIGEIVAFQLEGSESSKSVQIPVVWYPDRYMKSEREAALRMRQQQASIKEQFERIAILENKLTNYNSPGGKTLKVSDLLQAALKHDNAQLTKEDLGLDQAGEDPEDVEMMIMKPGKYDLSAELRKVIESIDKKLLALNEEKEKARNTLQQLSRLYTEPSEDPKQPPLHPYTLRGVSTTKNTTYVCRRSEPDLIDMDLDDDGSKTEGDQWWKINFAFSGSNPVSVEKTTEAKVIKAAMTESKNTLLVYASSLAMQTPFKPLPQALENFVRTDNLAFSDEFPRSEESQSDDVFNSPKSPGKRKYDDSEDDSQDLNNRWSAGGIPMRRENSMKSARPDQSAVAKDLDIIVGIDPLQVTDGEPAQEMQERGNLRMSMLASGRNENSAVVRLETMDLDQVVEDADIREESAAVKRVGFVE